MFKVIYCKNKYFIMWPLAFITLCNLFGTDSANFRKYSAYIELITQNSEFYLT